MSRAQSQISIHDHVEWRNFESSDGGDHHEFVEEEKRREEMTRAQTSRTGSPTVIKLVDFSPSTLATLNPPPRVPKRGRERSGREGGMEKKNLIKLSKSSDLNSKLIQKGIFQPVRVRVLYRKRGGIRMSLWSSTIKPAARCQMVGSEPEPM